MGRQARCKANLRQIGLGLILYVQDHDRYPYALAISDEPVVRTDPNNKRFAVSYWDWDQALEPYTGSQWTNALFKCPSYQGETLVRLPVPDGSGMFNPMGSYAYNAWGSGSASTMANLGLGGFGDSQSRRPQRHESEIRSPSDMLAIGDAMGYDNDYHVRAIRNGPTGSPYPSHRLSLNMVFCDGHIENVKAVRLFQRTEGARRRWNYDNESHAETWEKQ